MLHDVQNLTERGVPYIHIFNIAGSIYFRKAFERFCTKISGLFLIKLHRRSLHASVQRDARKQATQSDMAVWFPIIGQILLFF